jgi:hypothetical protein
MKTTYHSENSKILQILIQTTSGQHPCPPLNHHPHSHLTKERLGVVDYQAICQLNPKLVSKRRLFTLTGYSGCKRIVDGQGRFNQLTML